MLLIRPEVIEGESLASFTHRLAKANVYPSGSNLAKILRCDAPRISKNDFDDKMVEKLSQISGCAAEKLKAMSAEVFQSVLGETFYQQMIQRRRVKYCPACITEGVHRHCRIWLLYPLTVCTEHMVLLIDKCDACGAYISMDNYMRGKCSRCGHSYLASPYKRIEPESIVYLSQKDLTDRISGRRESLIFPELSLQQYLSLAYHSFYLLDGMTSFTHNELIPIRGFLRNKNGQQSVENATTAFANVHWMYSNFPTHYYQVLQAFFRQKYRTKYEKKAFYENVFSDRAFLPIQKAYDDYWLEQWHEGKIRSDFSVFKSNQALLTKRVFLSREEIKDKFGFGKVEKLADSNMIQTKILKQGSRKRYFVEKNSLEKAVQRRGQFITRKQAASLLGIGRDAVPSILQAGLLHEHKTPFSEDTLLVKNEVAELMKRCRGRKGEKTDDDLSFHQALIKFSVNGLTIVKLIMFIMEGRLSPRTSSPEEKLSDLFFNEQQLWECVSDLRREKQHSDGYYMKDVMLLLHVGESTMNRLMVEGIFVPERILLLRDGRKQYLFNMSYIDRFLSEHVTIDQASKEFQVSEVTIRRRIKEGNLQDAMRGIGKKYWQSRAEIRKIVLCHIASPAA
ncbi:TniQ family protein [Paenibacillus sp. FJAT-26967]|uniref:TniQ family protein n=1 Tax=Paenibacillus sp. FJAT-26967 TaxID=1729690 RepID=UPI0008384AA0|nr:TniQ family protein [Paenibacillus sp. FJAT-26967]